MTRKISTARRRVEKLYGPPGSSPPIDPSYQFPHLTNFETSLPVVIYCRVSMRQQASRQTLKRRKRHLAYEVIRKGYKIEGSFTTSIHGWDHERDALKKACYVARQCGGIVVAHSWDRFIRSKHFKSNQPFVLPNEQEMDRLRTIADGVPLTTIWGSDLPPDTINCLSQKTFAGGVPSTGDRHPQEIRKVIGRYCAEHHYPNKCSWRKLESIIGYSQSTLRIWANTWCVTPSD